MRRLTFKKGYKGIILKLKTCLPRAVIKVPVNVLILLLLILFTAFIVTSAVAKGLKV